MMGTGDPVHTRYICDHCKHEISHNAILGHEPHNCRNPLSNNIEQTINFWQPPTPKGVNRDGMDKM